MDIYTIAPWNRSVASKLLYLVKFRRLLKPFLASEGEGIVEQPQILAPNENDCEGSRWFTIKWNRTGRNGPALFPPAVLFRRSAGPISSDYLTWTPLEPHASIDLDGWSPHRSRRRSLLIRTRRLTTMQDALVELDHPRHASEQSQQPISSDGNQPQRRAVRSFTGSGRRLAARLGCRCSLRN